MIFVKNHGPINKSFMEEKMKFNPCKFKSIKTPSWISGTGWLFIHLETKIISNHIHAGISNLIYLWNNQYTGSFIFLSP